MVLRQNQSRLWWWLLALAIVAMLTYVGRHFIGTFVFALFLYYFGRPVSQRLETHIPGRWAATVTMVVIVFPFAVVLGVFVAVVLGQLSAAGTDIQRVVQAFAPFVDVAALPNTPGEVVEVLRTQITTDTLRALSENLVGAFSAITGVILNITLIVVTVSLLLSHDQTLATWFRGNIAGEETAVYTFLATVDRELRQIYFGQMLTVFSVMILAWILYSLLNLVAPSGLSIPHPLLLGLLTGVATFVPLIGRSLVYVPVTVYLAILAVSSNPLSVWFPAVTLLSGLFGLDSVVRYVVRPYLTAQRTSAGLMLISYLLGAAVFGWYGVFLAPLLLLVTIQFFTAIFPPLVRGEPIYSTENAIDDHM